MDSTIVKVAPVIKPVNPGESKLLESIEEAIVKCGLKDGMTGSDGVLRGASGGHCDTAACAKLTMILSPLIRGRKNVYF